MFIAYGNSQDNSLGSDVPLKNPERSVSSFALQLKYMQDSVLEETLSESSHKDYRHITNKEHSDVDSLHDNHECGFTKLRGTFEELGICMMELGVRLARVCDRAIGSHELEQSILDSCTAKGRLIHYHSISENLYLKELGRTKKSTKGQMKYCFSPHVVPEQGKQILVGSGNSRGGEAMSLEVVNPQACTKRGSSRRTSLSNLWQQWHYDYGIFTVLTSPMFMSPCESQTIASEDGFHMSCAQERCPPDDHTHLQIFDPKKNKILVVKSPPESFIVQVAESADILSKGMLCSTLHSVSRPVEKDNVSRETFVVFLQPAWDKVFSIPGCSITAVVRDQESSTPNSNVTGNNDEQISLDSDSTCIRPSDRKSRKLSQEILRVIPPLSSRLKDGMTFAEFSRETTKQYYGDNGMQSKS